MRHRAKPEEAENPFWITYSDLLSSMVLLLLILLVVFIKISEAQRIQLEDSQKALQSKVNENKKLLELADSKLRKESANLIKLKRDLRDLRDKLLKERNLRIELQDNDLTLSVDQRLLFDDDSEALKPDGKVFLTKFIPLLATTITKDDYSNLITGVVFEGRADPSFHNSDWDEAYLHNLGVTLDRSKNVVKYIFGREFAVAFAKDKGSWIGRSRERLRYLVLSSGRSSVDRVKKEIASPDDVKRNWRSRKLWTRKDQGSRQVVVRLELYNPLPDLEFEEK